MPNVADSIERACEDLREWLATLPPWENRLGPLDRDGESFRGPTLLGEADCRMHLVLMLAKQVADARWLHQEVLTSAYLLPGLADRRSNSQDERYRPDIGVVDPRRLRLSLTPEEMRDVRWNALIEVKFRGLNAGNVDKGIEADLRKLAKLRDYCDRAYVIVVEEAAPCDTAPEEALRATAAEVDVDRRFVRGINR